MVRRNVITISTHIFVPIAMSSQELNGSTPSSAHSRMKIIINDISSFDFFPSRSLIFDVEEKEKSNDSKMML